MAMKSVKDFLDKLLDFSTQMAAASIAIVGLLLVITYEFQHAGEFTESLTWLRFAHLGIAAAIFFALSSFIGLIQRAPFLPKTLRKPTSIVVSLIFIIGWILLLYLLLILFVETY
jgi:hypothetical protein